VTGRAATGPWYGLQLGEREASHYGSPHGLRFKCEKRVQILPDFRLFAVTLGGPQNTERAGLSTSFFFVLHDGNILRWTKGQGRVAASRTMPRTKNCFDVNPGVPGLLTQHRWASDSSQLVQAIARN